MVRTNNEQNIADEHNNRRSVDPILKFDQLTWKQIQDLDTSETVFFLPISPLEEHGPHLPVGTDYITAQDIALASMKQIHHKHPSFTCVMLPAIPLGFTGFNTDFPGSVSVSSRCIKQVVYQYGKMLAEHGFYFFIICTYHMALGHLKGIYAAMKKLRGKYNLQVCEPWSPVFYSDKIAKNEPHVDVDTHTEVHAGFRETSLMRYTHPSLVDPLFKSLPFVYTDKVRSPAIIFNSFKKLGVSEGYLGTPSKADSSYGKWFFEYTVSTYVDAVERMIQNKNLPDLPKHIKRQMNLLFWL